MENKYAMRKWVYWLVFGTIIAGLIVPYGAQVICTIWFPDASVGLDVWNQFVSIALGIVATVLSIVSLIMGFKNYDDTLSIQEKYTQTMQQSERALEKITEIAGELGKLREDVSRIGHSKSDVETTTSTAQAGDLWDKEPKEI